MMILLQYLVNSVLKLLPSAFNHFARWGIKSIMDEKHENPKKHFSQTSSVFQNQNGRNNKTSYKRKTSHKIHCTLYINTVLHIQLKLS